MSTDLHELVGHSHSVSADQPIGDVLQIFADHGFDFMAVLEGETVLGLCSRRDVGMLLGSKYGFSLFALKPIRELLLPQATRVSAETPINDVFAAVFAREEKTFFDDVILTGVDGRFLGLIFTMTLVRLQNHFHLASIDLLERQSREIRLKNEQIEADLRLSRELQQALLPAIYPKFPARSPSGAEALRFHHYYRPLGLVGGDFFLVKKVAEMVAGVFIADVMGHGISSAIITAMLRAMLESLEEDQYRDPEGLLGHVNQELTTILEQHGQASMFATALYLLVDAENQRLHYASAGHPLPLHVKVRKGRVETLHHADPGTILGVFGDARFPKIDRTYEPGDSIIVFTDGITEVENPSGKEFGVDRLCEAVTSNLGRTTQEIFFDLIMQARQFAGKGGFTDDVCLIGIDLA